MDIRLLRTLITAKGGPSQVSAKTGIHRSILQNWLCGAQPRDNARIELIHALPDSVTNRGRPFTHVLVGTMDDGEQAELSRHQTITGAARAIFRMARETRARLQPVVYELGRDGEWIGDPISAATALEIFDESL